MPAVLRALGPLLDAAGCVRLRLQRLPRPDVQEPAALPAAGPRVRAGRASCPPRTCATRFAGRRLGRPEQRPHALKAGGRDDRAGRRRRPARRAATTTPGRRPGRPAPPTCTSASPTRPTRACSTRWPPTASPCCSPATPTAARSACPASARWSPTATWTARHGQGPAPLARHATRWLHVSAGLGTHPTAPVRFACPPGGDPAHAGTPLTADAGIPDCAGRRGVGYVLPGTHRGVAQLGSALRSGRRGRGFKSRHPDREVQVKGLLADDGDQALDRL